MTERIEKIKTSDLVPFENHPFKARSGMEQEELTESIKSGGLLTPIIVRSSSDSKYEIISGHRRVEVCRKLGVDTIPAIVKELTNEEAVIAMVDANLQRENLLPSEKAFAYKMKLDAIKHQGKATSRQLVGKPESADKISDTDSGRQVQRYIRLTYLVPELLKLVDEGRIALTPAVELSYLLEHEQRIIAEEIEYADATPSLSQAQRLRKFSNEGNLFTDTVFAILSEEKPNQKEMFKVPMERIKQYAPKATSEQLEAFVIKACEHYRKYLIRQRERDTR